MTHRSFGVAFILILCLFLPGRGLAQTPVPITPPGPGFQPATPADPTGVPLIRRPDWEATTTRPAHPPVRGHKHNWDVGITAGPGLSTFDPGYYHSGWPYGPRVAPDWSYPGLIGGPFVGYPWGWPGYSARAGQNWSNGLSLYGPPVPVYGPVPGILGNSDLVHQWQAVPSPGLGYGWFGVYAASPRPRPLTVSVWPTIESVPAAQAPANPPPAAIQPGGGSLILSVKVPVPTAEVFVDGVKTMQTGTDRLFESPPLEAGKQFKYEVTARWLQNGVTVERKMAVVGVPGEVVRVDFTKEN